MEALYKKTAIFTGITVVIYLILFFFCDRAVDLWIHNNYANSWLPRIGGYISTSAKGAPIELAIALGLIIVVFVDPDLSRRWTRNLLYICVSAALAIIIGEGLKYLLGRYRPIMLFEHNLYGFHFFGSKWTLNSTPSGHTTRAFAIMTASSLLFRRLALLFIMVAVIIGASRLAVTDHYPSDVVLGAFIGIFTALWTYKYFFLKRDRSPEKN